MSAIVSELEWRWTASAISLDELGKVTLQKVKHHRGVMSIQFTAERMSRQWQEGLTVAYYSTKHGRLASVITRALQPGLL